VLWIVWKRCYRFIVKDGCMACWGGDELCVLWDVVWYNDN
jgi:hypothetical protein